MLQQPDKQSEYSSLAWSKDKQFNWTEEQAKSFSNLHDASRQTCQLYLGKLSYQELARMATQVNSD